MAKRYGVLPSTFLKMDAEEFQFNQLVWSVGIEDANKQLEKQAKRNGKKVR